jgi:two-component system sensor kinase FixL
MTPITAHANLPSKRSRLERAGRIYLYVALYVLLDWLSLIQPFALGITPWNPPAGLCLAMLLREGNRFLPATIVALALSETLFRGLPLFAPETIATVLTIALVYAVAAQVLRRTAPGVLNLATHRDLLLLLGAGLAAALVVAILAVGLFYGTGRLAGADPLLVGLHFWIGDMIGIAVLTPFILLLGKHRFATAARPSIRAREAMAQVAAIAFGLWVVFGLEPTDHFEFAYVLFLPLIWIALRGGLPWASWGIVATQFGLILAVQFKGLDAEAVTQFQLLMAAVAVTGLLLGSVEEERRRAEARVKEHEAELAQAARLTATGEMAGALAHELNQPLTALISFVRAGQTALHRSRLSPEEQAQATAMIDKAVVQAQRAGEIIRTTREFLRRGDLRRARADLAPIAADAIELLRPLAAQNRARLDVAIAPNLPAALVDPLQVEQVIVNLVRNAAEEIGRAGPWPGTVTVAIAPSADEPGFLEVSVRDTGPGFAPEMAERLFKPFSTTKPAGTGLGLAISRTIIEAHGGRIWLVQPTEGRGADLRFTVPIDLETNDALR